MKEGIFWQTFTGAISSEGVFNYLISTLNPSLTYWDYFVDWKKVYENVKQVEMDLNLLNYLIGKEDIEGAMKELFHDHPEVIRALPLLVAVRQNEIKILTEIRDGQFNYEDYVFNLRGKLSEEDIGRICLFVKKTGLADLFKRTRSLVDYVTGVEVGLDSHGRKSRGGAQMENVVKATVTDICMDTDLILLEQASPAMIKTHFQRDLHFQNVEKPPKRFDLAVKSGSQIYIIETNYYGGGGSKLKATAGEYEYLYKALSEVGFKFIWITDGQGWLTAREPLKNAFNTIDFVLNLKMAASGLLEHILVEQL